MSVYVHRVIIECADDTLLEYGGLFCFLIPFVMLSWKTQYPNFLYDFDLTLI